MSSLADHGSGVSVPRLWSPLFRVQARLEWTKATKRKKWRRTTALQPWAKNNRSRRAPAERPLGAFSRQTTTFHYYTVPCLFLDYSVPYRQDTAVPYFDCSCRTLAILFLHRVVYHRDQSAELSSSGAPCLTAIGEWMAIQHGPTQRP